ncbi:MAG: family 20 glycosylhydrolase [Burkholderiales bacterium]|nr:family 20 glycosylhydrolase [Burkholderiales bacterium]
MKRIFWSLIFLCFAIGTAHAQQVPIIPLPQSVQLQSGHFELNAGTRIFAMDAGAQDNARILQQSVQLALGLKLPLVLGAPDARAKNLIVFADAPKSEVATNREAYRLHISPQRILFEGSATAQFYAVQSFLQLLPSKKSTALKLAALQIDDTPRFAWRGLHLDVGRHMSSVAFIKKLLDQMAQLKMNTFHWHLTEDQGWRIEIKRYPKLTQIGAYRKETMKGKQFNPTVGDGVAYGGFYTQEQIKEVIAYAAQRHIMVVPEIELPGHSQAALAAYPELACTPGPFEVATTWGVFEDIYCPSEATFQFLENVLTEVMDLFPAPYVHIGGDEAPKTRWKASAVAQEVMRREGLKNEEELQSYFIRRVEKMINSKGKRLIGWDEILEGGLAPDATVMSWRGEEGGIAAAKQGHDVIMSPTAWCYFDAGQGAKEQEMWQLEGNITLEKVYSYDPSPKELSREQRHFIRGVQANVWTEYLPTPEKIEYMVFPRLLAMAEVAWSVQSQRDFAQFEQRLSPHYARLSRQGIAYRIPRPVGLDDVKSKAGMLTLTLQAPVEGSQLFVSVDGSEPDTRKSAYKKPMKLKLVRGKNMVVKVLTVLADGRHSAVQQAIFSGVKK